MRQSWETRSDQLGLRSVVTFSGFLSQKDCAERLKDADALVLPSLFECGGAVVLEAMAAGLPVIATAWGGPMDYLDPTCGILVEPDSREALVEGFAAAMKTLAQSPQVRVKMGESGYARARQSFDWDRKIDQILELYRRALSPMSRDQDVMERARP
jgi:glycosyltransferase involved in cell wall biosynthesis